MEFLKQLWLCITGPRFYGEYHTEKSPEIYYEPNVIEAIGDSVITGLKFSYYFIYYTSPLSIPLLLYNDKLTIAWMAVFIKASLSATVLMFLSTVLRGLGRFRHSSYRDFIQLFGSLQKENSADFRSLINSNDFEFCYHPVTYTQKRHYDVVPSSEMPQYSGLMCLFCKILGYLFVRSFGLRQLYPGCTAVFNTILHTALLNGRFMLVRDHSAVRSKLKTLNGEHIDCVFVDKRTSGTPEGNTLILCCEGNASFYEIGSTSTPLSAGYSVFGWNHPGFGGSTGRPWNYVEQEFCETVLEYVVEKLGFHEKDIIVYGWSIGGYSAAYMATVKPDIQALILDATFDDLFPLAASRMPSSWRHIVKYAVYAYLDLPISLILRAYEGPLLIVRRTRDEMMSTFDISTNRANYLLRHVVEHRYPDLISSESISLLDEFCSQESGDQVTFLTRTIGNVGDVRKDLETFLKRKTDSEDPATSHVSSSYTSQLVVYLSSLYMVDFESSHCVPLPAEYYKRVWYPGHVYNDPCHD